MTSHKEGCQKNHLWTAPKRFLIRIKMSVYQNLLIFTFKIRCLYICLFEHFLKSFHVFFTSVIPDSENAKKKFFFCKQCLIDFWWHLVLETLGMPLGGFPIGLDKSFVQFQCCFWIGFTKTYFLSQGVAPRGDSYDPRTKNLRQIPCF